jgi:hypothetical protein
LTGLLSENSVPNSSWLVRKMDIIHGCPDQGVHGFSPKFSTHHLQLNSCLKDSHALLHVLANLVFSAMAFLLPASRKSIVNLVINRHLAQGMQPHQSQVAVLGNSRSVRAAINHCVSMHNPTYALWQKSQDEHIERRVRRRRNNKSRTK